MGEVKRCPVHGSQLKYLMNGRSGARWYECPHDDCTVWSEDKLQGGA